MKIKHNNKNYTLDITRSINLGVLKKVFEPLTDPKHGDLVSPNQDAVKNRTVIVMDFQRKYWFCGLGGEFQNFSNGGYTYDELIKHLIAHEYVRITNLNADLKKLMTQ
jgi:hypothetical protein